MKKILYAPSGSEMDAQYDGFKRKFYNHPQLRRHCELLWERRQSWALFFHLGLPMQGNNTNNYVERSFGILKDSFYTNTSVQLRTSVPVHDNEHGEILCA